MCVPDSCSDSHTSAPGQGVGVSPMSADPSAVPMERLSSAVVPHEKVTAFVWSVIRHIIPAVSLYCSLSFSGQPHSKVSCI